MSAGLPENSPQAHASRATAFLATTSLVPRARKPKRFFAQGATRPPSPQDLFFDNIHPCPRRSRGVSPWEYYWCFLKWPRQSPPVRLMGTIQIGRLMRSRTNAAITTSALRSWRVADFKRRKLAIKKLTTAEWIYSGRTSARMLTMQPWRSAGHRFGKL